MVDDLNHLVKGGRLSNGSALLGNLLKIKPILYFNEGAIEVYEKVRTEKKAIKRLIEILEEQTVGDSYHVAIIHANCPEKAESFKALLVESGLNSDLAIVPFGAVIGTHLGEGAIAFEI
ncbi:DegV family EDD domain-containing protein, partial [Enterococcus faecalis]|nr:DegV family EDD domain-containing protein [Enterococcus faecalis]